MAYTPVRLNFLILKGSHISSSFRHSQHICHSWDLPQKLEMSKIIPIFKADDETNTSDFRPISLLSNFNKIFEKILYDRMRDFIELLYSSQYGFRQAHSTQHAILDMLETIQTNVDKKLFSCGVFIDLKKSL